MDDTGKINPLFMPFFNTPIHPEYIWNILCG